MSQKQQNSVRKHSSEIDQYWLSLAIAESQKAAHLGEVPVGAVLVDDNNNFIASAHNRPIYTNDATAHAEIEVIRKAGSVINNYRLIGTTLYVTLEPCPMCTGALIHARVSRVVFGAKDPRTGACGTAFSLHDSPQLNHSFSAEFIEREDYIASLKAFFKSRR